MVQGLTSFNMVEYFFGMKKEKSCWFGKTFKCGFLISSASLCAVFGMESSSGAFR